MVKFSLKPTPAKVIIPVILIISFIAVTFYGKSIMANYPACELKDMILKIQEARKLNDTSAPIWKELNESAQEISKRMESTENLRYVAYYYHYALFADPFLKDNNEGQIVINLLSKNQADCIMELLKEMKSSSLGGLYQTTDLAFDPDDAFKNLIINSLILLIESYLLICVIEFMINLARKK